MNKKNFTINYACLDCKKVFKKNKYNQDSEGNWEEITYKVVCPQCKKTMYETGSAFKAPKLSDTKAWAKLKPLFEGGYKFTPDSGNPFKEKEPVKSKKEKLPESEFRKAARKRNNA